jgi:hypothetical protein
MSTSITYILRTGNTLSVVPVFRELPPIDQNALQTEPVDQLWNEYATPASQYTLMPS